MTADALYTQQTFCLGVILALGDYLLAAYGNQPSLSEDLRLFFAEPPADCRDWRTASTCEKWHGRLEMRELIASTELNEFLLKQWAGVEQVFRLRRRVERPLYCTEQIISGITSLTPQAAPLERLVALIRGH
jgi:hypothetical protein